MPRLPAFSALLAAAALLAVPALAHAAPPVEAARTAIHLLAVRLPDGEVATIRYRGPVPPVVTLRLPTPVAFTDTADPALATLERMQALMRRQTAVMLHEAALLSAFPAAGRLAPIPSVFPGALPGTFPAMFPSAPDAAGGCVSGTRITQVGNAAPQVVSFRSPGCGPSPAAPNGAADRIAPPRRPDLLPVPVPDTVPGSAVPRSESGPRLIEARADQAAPLSLVR